MAIYVIEGKPGSGKTYFAVYHLLKSYFTYDEVLKEHFPKGVINIITNIEDLRLNHFQLDEMVKKAGGVENFFTVDFQREVIKKMGKLVYVIDEAGAPDKFHRNFKNEKVLFFFQYHRHLGIDLYLIAPNSQDICFAITRLAEYVLRAYERTRVLGGRFRYDKYLENQKVGLFVVKGEQRVWSLYKSMVNTEGEKIKSGFRPLIIAGVVFAGLAIAGFVYLISNFKSGDLMGVKKAEKKEMVSEKRLRENVGVKVNAEKGVEKKPLYIVDASELTKKEYRLEPVGYEKKEVKEQREVEKAFDVRDYTELRFHVHENGDYVIWTDMGKTLSDLEFENALIGAIRIHGKYYVKKEVVSPSPRVRGVSVGKAAQSVSEGRP